MQHIYSSSAGFAALKTDGTVVAWGGKVPPAVESALAQQKEDGTVLSTTSNENAIAAIKADSSVVTWGQKDWGGDSSKVQAQLAPDVQHIYSHNPAFIARKADGAL